MYRTCLFCHADLGTNEAVEHFPVGRRLAFDPAKGRLWVVCRSCERWNLSPLEERWEAIDECERLFRGTTLRMSTEHVGLARIREGLDLVRIGDPLRPELAAWRYGDQFGRRRRKHLLMMGISTAAGVGVALGHSSIGFLAGGGMSALNVVSITAGRAWRSRTVARVRTPDGTFAVNREHIAGAKIVRRGGQWALVLAHRPLPGGSRSLSERLSTQYWRGLGRWRIGDPRTELTPEYAIPALGALLPALNVGGGSRRHVASAVDLLENTTDTRRLFDAAARTVLRPRTFRGGDEGSLRWIPREARLALEMATHEDDERRALEGELHVLEERWKEAEEIAAISDDMFLPSAITDWIAEARSRAHGSANGGRPA